MDISVWDYLARRSRWTRIRAYSMPGVTLVEPFTESIFIGLCGAYAMHGLFALPFWHVFLIHMWIWLTIDLALVVGLT